ncbi:MAG: DUF72 domain-containing protein [Gemmatimonadota bacterium]|nr:DUF72 domain-containing protein [Gemmatimonadota bacterium]
MAKVRIGLSGWSYDAWQGDFYPGDLAKSRRLEYAADRFASLEINGTFYSLQRPATFRDWYERTPAGFVWAVKASRYITHSKRLNEPREAVANFLASGPLALGGKLGPILWQLPGRLEFDADRVERFLELLPKDTESAADLAGDHDPDVVEESFTGVEENHRMRHAVEPRHESFFDDAFPRLARDHGVAIVFADSGEWPYTEELTAGFVYLRLHGSPETYASGYGDGELDRWADRIRAWRDGGEPDDAERLTGLAAPRRKSRDVYVYFDNDARGHAPWNALDLAERLGVGWADEHAGG